MVKLLGLNNKEVKYKVQRGEVTIAVYGLGHVGLPLASVFAERGAMVIGVDIDDEKVKLLNEGNNYIIEEPGLSELVRKNVKEGRLTATTNGVEAAMKADVMIITVPVLADRNGYVDLRNLTNAVQIIGEGLKKGDIVIIETTLPPGTTENMISLLMEKSGLKIGEFGVAHAPERMSTGTAIRDITRAYPKIVGASDNKTLEAVVGLYETINEKGVIPVSSIKVAEAVKVFEGIYRDVNIALANELALWAEENGLDVWEIIKAANSQPYCHIHRPGVGVGGHCIPVYPWFIINTARRRKPLLTYYARILNDSMPYHIIELLIEAFNIVGKPIKESNILVMGLTFRGGVKSFINTPADIVIRELRKLDTNVYVYDPLCVEEDARKFNAKWKSDFKDVDAIVIITDHKEFLKLDLEKISKEVRTRIIVDGRGIVDPDEARKYGFVYVGVGRTIAGIK